MMAKSVGPTALRDLLDSYGLKLIKRENTPMNIGKTPELVVCELLDIKVRSHTVEWAEWPKLGNAPVRHI